MTAVGLLPIAASGADIKSLMEVLTLHVKSTLHLKSLKMKLTSHAALRRILTVKVTQLKSWQTTNHHFNTSQNMVETITG